MNCVVIEDDLMQRELLIGYIIETDSLNLVAEFRDAQAALAFLEKMEVDIIFLDVEMPGMTGMDFLDLYDLPKKTKIVLTTSSSSYAIQAFEKGVTDYLLKPISYDRFSKSVNRIGQLNRGEPFRKNYLFIKSGRVKVKIMFEDVLWIKSASEYVILYTLKGKYMVYSSMSEILSRLPNDFVRVHRSNIVSISKIEKIYTDGVEVGGQLVKVSKSYKDDLENRIGA